ncbi:MAG: NADP-dependent oxidoreductase [Ignavibacteriales bacterium]
MPDLKNRQILLVKRPVGMPDESIFKMVESPVPEPGAGEVLVKSEFISVDPYMRGRMSEQKSYVASYKLDEVIAGGVVGRVVKTRGDRLREGDYVAGTMGWADYSIARENELQKINQELAPVSTALGILGMTGLTAYFGLLDVGQPQAGETVVVSGAAGAVGTVVGQIAKIKGCRAVGITGSQNKIKYLVEELGFDEAINYKETPDLKVRLEEACPGGIDVYFDNVGGKISDAVMFLINNNARIPICGQISLYNEIETPVGPRVQRFLLSHTAMMKGFLVRQYSERFEEGITHLAGWYREGRLKSSESITEGLENTPRAFIGLFNGENLGKQLVKVA